ncbi:MAG: type I-E CRISPR-associated endonuclease Cas1e [Chloroflexota bacterium]
MQNLRGLPKLRDSLSYIYIEHAVLEKRDNALLVLQETGKTALPVATLCLVMLGPGTSITHAAVKLLTENGCNIHWTAQDMDNYYAQGMGETRSARHILRQAEMVSDPEKRLQVVYKMYQKRFDYPLSADLTLEQIRGMEGVRVRTEYQNASRIYGVTWNGRVYDRKNWQAADPVNRALSAANALLYGVCHVAIASGGYSPSLGFVHSGYFLAFVHDIADLYKSILTIPTAFQVAAESAQQIESRVRREVREKIRQTKLLAKILPDIDELLDIQRSENNPEDQGEVLAQPWWNDKPSSSEEVDPESEV